MKELSIEEKAKAYDEALERARKLYEQGTITESLGYVFPELKESEDERIRKWIIGVLSTYERDRDLRNAAIAWLEKQGEQKSQRMISAEAKEAMYGKPAWSEEDERRYRGLHNLIYSTQYCDSRKEFSDFLNSLKDRVQIKPQQEWSEEDEMIALSIEQVMNCTSLLNIVPEKIDKIRTWLTSLKERI